MKLGKVFWDTRNLANYGTTDMFFRCSIEISTECNRRCKYCPTYKHPKPKGFMNIQVFMKAIQDLKDINYRGYIHPLLFGEPLMDKRLGWMVKRMSRELPQARVSIYTNADFLTPELFKELEPNVFDFIITDHGSLREDLPKHPKIKIQHLPTKLTRGGSVEVDYRRIMKKCSLATEWIVILKDGDVIPCCEDYFETMKFGNIKQDSIYNIWNYPDYKEARRLLRRGVSVSQACKFCFGEL